MEPTLDDLAAAPNLLTEATVVPEFEDETICELLVRPYRLGYRVLDDEVLILALVHGARRIWRV